MAEERLGTVDSIRTWVSEHKLRTVGTLWLTGLAGSFAYNWSQPNMKTSSPMAPIQSIEPRQLEDNLDLNRDIPRSRIPEKHRGPQDEWQTILLAMELGPQTH
eukprot:Gb_00046 [translate_table: standard]